MMSHLFREKNPVRGDADWNPLGLFVDLQGNVFLLPGTCWRTSPRLQPVRIKCTHIDSTFAAPSLDDRILTYMREVRGSFAAPAGYARLTRAHVVKWLGPDAPLPARKRQLPHLPKNGMARWQVLFTQWNTAASFLRCRPLLHRNAAPLDCLVPSPRTCEYSRGF